MWEQFKNYLLSHWLHFLKVIINPWAISSMAIAAVIWFYSSNTLLISIWTSIVGGIIATLWFNLSEERLIVARGKVAVRNLKVLFNTINSTQLRLLSHLKALRDCSKPDCEMPLQYLEEIDHLLTVFQEETMNSIEAWTDIIPDVDIRTKIGEITSQRQQLAALAAELEIVRKERDEAAQKSLEIEQYAVREKNLHEQIVNLKTQLTQKARQLQDSPLSGISGTSSITFPVAPPHWKGPEYVSFDGKVVVEIEKRCRNCDTIMPPYEVVCPGCHSKNP